MGSVVVAPPQLPWEPVDQSLMEKIPAETALYHVPYPKGLLWKPLRRLSPLGIWLPKAWAACRRAICEHQPDALLTSGPPHLVHLLGRELRNRYGLPWIADFRDPWVAGERLDVLEEDASDATRVSKRGGRDAGRRRDRREHTRVS